MKKPTHFWEELNASFWFVPILILLCAIGMASGLIYLDNRYEFVPSGFAKYLFPGSVDSARSILTITAGAMIGVAGTVFSITLVALTLASSQLGSRLLRNFMYDKLNQVVLGTYVSTFVYCLLILSAIKENESLHFVPVMSVFGALLAAVAGIILLIVFIHHISVSIQSDKVISDISDAMSKSISRLFPEDIGHGEARPSSDLEVLKETFKCNIQVKCQKNGYLQSVDGDALMDIAKNNDWIIELKYRPGDFLVKGLIICLVHSHNECDEETAGKINNALIIGKVRTPLQDAEFSIHQLVEVAGRALSPGVNDPYTAIACIDNLTAVLCYLAKARFPSPCRYDQEDRLRIIADSLSFRGMLNAAFNQIRQYGEGNPSVIIRLMEAMITIMRFATKKEDKKELVAHASMILRAAEKTFSEKRDLEDLKERFSQLSLVE